MEKTDTQILVDGSHEIDRMRGEVMIVVNLIIGWVNSLQDWEWREGEKELLGPRNNQWNVSRIPEDKYTSIDKKPSGKLRCRVIFLHSSHPDGTDWVYGYNNFLKEIPSYWIVQDMHEHLKVLVDEMFNRYPGFRVWCKPFLRAGK